MNKGLHAAALLLTARDELLREVLPALPGALRYEALMIANAMAIAKRELDDGGECERQELRVLGVLLGMPEAPRLSVGENRALFELRFMLRSAIRGGDFDSPSQRQALIASLTRVTSGKLAISNPKVLGHA